ncbi:hypothetical protein Vi05172_g1738 [Venturia inaequalis]|nr:hypothetical protein Vi05172_g1738 [Venturia inaequalis]
MAIQQPKFPLFGFNNTYGIQAIDAGVYQGVTRKWATQDGCGTNIAACRKEAAKCDADNMGVRVAGGYTLLSKQSTTDVTQKRPSAFPPPYYIGYLNNQMVQEALGVPRNFTEDNFQVSIMLTGYDEMLGGHLENIGYLLDRGINVAMAYGDRDYSNNWLGGEAISLAVKYKDSAAFKEAGYQDLQVNASYVAGMVRQVGRLSFSRIFDAGQEAYAYQPEALLQVFQRTLASKDIATGSLAVVDGTYKTSGPASIFSRRNKVPTCPIKPICYLLAPSTCGRNQIEAVKKGFAVTKDFIFMGFTKDVPKELDPEYLRPKVPAGC